MAHSPLLIPKPIIKAIILSLLLSHALLAKAAVVLQYHHISNDTPFSTSTAPALFRQHIKYLIDNEFNISSLPDIVKALQREQPSPEKTVAITFDDGFISVYSHAFPILKAHNIPFTIFINTDPIQTKRPSHLSWEQLEEMKEHGATIANHTHEHSHLIYSGAYATNSSKMAKDKWRKAFIDEVESAQKLINNRLNQDIKLFAYPYGEFDQRSNELLAEMGYVGFGQHSGAIGVGMNLQSLPRYPASNSYGKFPQIETKLNSIAFENIEFKPVFGIISDKAENPPKLYIQGDKSALNSINCFGSSVGELPKTNIDMTTLLIKSEHSFSSRRFRYNCTAKSPTTGHFMWASIPWVNLTEDRQ